MYNSGAGFGAVFVIAVIFFVGFMISRGMAHIRPDRDTSKMNTADFVDDLGGYCIWIMGAACLGLFLFTLTL